MVEDGLIAAIGGSERTRMPRCRRGRGSSSPFVERTANLADGDARHLRGLDVCSTTSAACDSASGSALGPEDVYAGNYAGALEALDSGVTTLLDFSHCMNSPKHADEAVRGLA